MAHLDPIRARLRAGQPVRILGLGDSLTYGWDVERGFFDRFVDDLEQRFGAAALSRRTEGVPGDTAGGGARRLGRLLEPAPDLALIQFGLNDCFAGLAVDAFAGHLSDMVARLKEAGAAVILCTSCPLDHLGASRMVDAFYAAIARVAGEQDVQLAALHEYWLARAGVDEALFGFDGVHPTDRGHALMAAGLLDLFPADGALADGGERT